ncbi:hypothetical protein [Intestinimonas butyriciproducens]|uniref:hypothetical protein n=2 Tax=Intestinimonas butyriciproducens TaxID=1297617 RepID=UPI0034A5B84D
MKGGLHRSWMFIFFDALFLQNGPAGAAVDDEEHRSGEIQDHQCGEREQDRGKGAVRRQLEEQQCGDTHGEESGEYGQDPARPGAGCFGEEIFRYTQHGGGDQQIDKQSQGQQSGSDVHV